MLKVDSSVNETKTHSLEQSLEQSLAHSLEQSREAPEVLYPDSDGEPMADNTRQFNWIVTIEGGLDTLFRNDPNVFVAGDLLWYPVQGDNRTRLAPDAMVVFGRPKGHRGSYQQWKEDNLAPQVVFEVLSPGNNTTEMKRKREWYTRYGVDEYYEYDPDRGRLRGWRRNGFVLAPIANMQGWVSPLLNIKFGLEGIDLVLIGPDGRRFQSFVEIASEREELTSERARERARREEAEQRSEQERERADRLAARLRELGLNED